MEKIAVVEKVLKDFIKEFQSNPANFFYEEDIRALLFSKLYYEFEKHKEFYVGLLKDDYMKEYFEELKINPVKAEFGKDKTYKPMYGISNIDIAILSKKNDYTEGTNNYQRDCDIVIEIKYNNDNSKRSYKLYSFKSDIEKIKTFKNCHIKLGLALCFGLQNQTSLEYVKEKVDNNFKQITIEKINFEGNHIYAIYIPPKQDDEVYIYSEKI